MPTTDELKTLYKIDAGSRNMTPLLKTTGRYVWSGETKEGSSLAKYVGFHAGDWVWHNRLDSHILTRGFAVRSRK